MENADITIIGAGIIGLAIAAEIARPGINIYILEKNVEQRTRVLSVKNLMLFQTTHDLNHFNNRRAGIELTFPLQYYLHRFILYCMQNMSRKLLSFSSLPLQRWYFNVLYRTAKPDHAYVYEKVYQAYKRLFKEGRKPYTRFKPLFHAL